VREGEANVLTAGAVQQVLPGQTAAVDGTDPTYAPVRIGVGSDGFDTGPPAATAATTDARRIRFAADGRRRGSRSITDLEPGAEYGRSGTHRTSAGLGAISQRLLDRSGRLGTDMGRLCAVGYRRSITAAGPTSGPLGLVPRRLRRAAVWAPALVGWAGGPAEPVRDRRRTCLRLGPAGLVLPYRPGGDAVEWLLDPLQPAVCGECRGAPEFTTDPLSTECARRDHGVRIGARDAQSVRQPGQGPGRRAASAGPCQRADRTREPGRIPMRRVGDGTPPPASLLPTTARPGGARRHLATRGLLPSRCQRYAPVQPRANARPHPMRDRAAFRRKAPRPYGARGETT
jgi:hypothetical protein